MVNILITDLAVSIFQEYWRRTSENHCTIIFLYNHKKYWKSNLLNFSKRKLANDLWTFRRSNKCINEYKNGMQFHFIFVLVKAVVSCKRYYSKLVLHPLFYQWSLYFNMLFTAMSTTAKPHVDTNESI